MPIELILSELPGGYSLSAARPGDTVQIVAREFLSSEDGDKFLCRLEGFPSIVLGQLPIQSRPPPSQIDHMLIVVHRNRTCLVYINELVVIAELLPKRDIVAGEVVSEDDVAGVRQVKFENVDIPNEAGFFYIFSSGWRKALFYDLQPLRMDSGHPRDYDVGVQLGYFYTHLAFQDRLKISEPTWATLLAQGWFPFLSLSTSLVKDMANHAKVGWNIDELLPRVSAEVRKSIEKWAQKWRTRDFFSPHAELLAKAVERFKANDYVSAVSIIYPRIEGIMRAYHLFSRPTIAQTQKGLIESSTASRDERLPQPLLLLPEKFRRYLSDVYFAAFDPKSPSGISRHTVAHGVAPQDTFSEKAAVLGFLLLEQLSYYYAE